MSEQWFLDLDGVRSGPYQTSEVMSLVAEGEILPHHLIGTELKSQKWMTILEWRLHQNKSLETKKETTRVSTSHFSPIQERPSPPEPELPVTEEKKPWPVTTPTFPPPVKKQFTTSPATPPSDPAPSSGAKRDPMAEMFDMLQNTKQKREVKSQQSHAQAHAQTQMSPAQAGSSYATTSEKNNDSKSNGIKTVLVAMVITIVGFVLGQFFQTQKATEPVSPIPAKASPSPVPSNTPVNDQKTEVVDRSNDKITIKAQVPTTSPIPEHGKDMQELKDLKKELLELKALKEEIRNNNDIGHRNIKPGAPDEAPNPDGEDLDENGNPNNPSGEVHY